MQIAVYCCCLYGWGCFDIRTQVNLCRMSSEQFAKRKINSGSSPWKEGTATHRTHTHTQLRDHTNDNGDSSNNNANNNNKNDNNNNEMTMANNKQTWWFGKQARYIIWQLHHHISKSHIYEVHVCLWHGMFSMCSVQTRSSHTYLVRHIWGNCVRQQYGIRQLHRYQFGAQEYVAMIDTSVKYCRLGIVFICTHTHTATQRNMIQKSRNNEHPLNRILTMHTQMNRPHWVWHRFVSNSPADGKSSEHGLPKVNTINTFRMLHWTQCTNIEHSQMTLCRSPLAGRRSPHTISQSLFFHSKSIIRPYIYTVQWYIQLLRLLLRQQISKRKQCHMHIQYTDSA